MSEFEEQKKIRSKIETILSEYLDGEAKDTALAFTAYLRANGMTPQWGSVNSWKFSYKNRGVGYIKLINGSWHVCPHGSPAEYDDFAAAECLTGLISESLKPCENCLPCAPGRTIVFGGTQFPNRCGHFTIQFRNPNAVQIEGIKRLLEYRKKIILCHA